MHTPFLPSRAGSADIHEDKMQCWQRGDSKSKRAVESHANRSCSVPICSCQLRQPPWGELSPAAASLTSWKGSAGTVLCSAQVLPPGPIHPHEVSSRARCCLLARRCPDCNSGHCQNVRRVGIPDPTSDTSGAPALLAPWHLRGGRRTFRVTTCVVTAPWEKHLPLQFLRNAILFFRKSVSQYYPVIIITASFYFPVICLL